jgi:hypothetical protein
MAFSKFCSDVSYDLTYVKNFYIRLFNYVYWGVFPPVDTLLFMLKFEFCLNKKNPESQRPVN